MQIDGQGSGFFMAAKTRAARSRRRLRQPARKRAGKTLSRSKVARAAVRGAEAPAGAIEVALATFAHEVRTPLTGILALS